TVRGTARDGRELRVGRVGGGEGGGFAEQGGGLGGGPGLGVVLLCAVPGGGRLDGFDEGR
ncbi:hypothetical protein JHN48_31755, partial [Streptomyces sp. MBT72]|nr:hypothetical protein [Streptomyces sp. MBT72]